MNGVLVLCSRTGSLLYGQSYAQNFGLPESHRPVDALNLAAMLFALHINSRAVVIPSPGEAGGQGGGLKMYEVGHTTMHFNHNEQAHVLGVVFIETATGEEIGQYLAERVVEQFVDKYFLEDGPAADAHGAAGTPFKQLRPKASKSLLRSIFQELPGRIFELLLSRLDESQRPRWIFAVMSESFIAEIDWDDFLAAERAAEASSQGELGAPASVLASPYGTPRQAAAGVTGGIFNGLDTLATPVSTPFQTPRTAGASTQRKKHIPKVGYRTPKRRWWNAPPKPEQLASLGPLQHLYRDGSAELAARGGAEVEPTPAMLTSLVGLVKKAGKVLSSVGDVNDRLQSLEVRLRRRDVAAAAPSSPGSESGGAMQGQLAVTVLRASDDFLIALPSSASCGGPTLFRLIYEDLLRLRIWMRFLSAQKIVLPRVIE